MNDQRDCAVIIKKKDGTFGIDFCKGQPTQRDDGKIIDIVHRKDGETEIAFRERAVRYVHEVCE